MICGILLAAGSARRFGGHKLLHSLPDGIAVGAASARNLQQGVTQVLAVVRTDDHQLAAMLRAEGIATVACDHADRGISASLATGIRATPDADGWLITLADMPWIRPQTIRAVAAMLENGASLAAPCYGGRLGHPVGFARTFRADLLNLSGDRGARELLRKKNNCLQQFHCDDPAVLLDIDRLEDVTGFPYSTIRRQRSSWRINSEVPLLSMKATKR